MDILLFYHTLYTYIRDIEIESVNSLFERAIEKSRSSKHYPTLIPALYEYGKYLCPKKKSKAVKLLKEARKIAEEYGLNGELEKINHICKELNIHVKVSKHHR